MFIVNFSFESHCYHIEIKCAQIHPTAHLAEGKKSQMLDKIPKFLRNGRKMKFTCAFFSKIERLGVRSTESYSNMIEFLAFCAQNFFFSSLKWRKFSENHMWEIFLCNINICWLKWNLHDTFLIRTPNKILSFVTRFWLV